MPLPSAVERLWAADAASRAAGVTVDDAGPGRATARMPVSADKVQGHGTCHGGYVFLLADTAFAMACNADGRRTVAQACDIVFLAPAREGDVLVATAVERGRSGRTGVYDVSVHREAADGTVEAVAEFRGQSRTTAAAAPPGVTAPSRSTTAPPRGGGCLDDRPVS